MQLIQYLNDYFHTGGELLAAAGIDAAGLARLQQRRMVPRASYRLRIDVACNSVFGPHTEQDEVEYYARGCASWIGDVRALAGEEDAFGHFARLYRSRLERRANEGMVTDLSALNGGIEVHLRAEWDHFLNGTYGLCTKSGLPADIADKELAIAIIEGISASVQALTRAETVYLSRIVDMLDTASALFAPHEVARSSRRRLIDEVRKQHQLAAGAL